ncbi:MAG: peptide chain release factor N(5)-glutamine methyltransferase [Lachnospiraceae bacterium]|nr:peptide chain release factor N(5)-glutamine methyltransferase [Lachnospiraceae bacterium]
MDLHYGKVYKWGEEQLEGVGISEAKLDARLLLEHVCGTDRNTLLIHGDMEVSEKDYKCYVNYIAERKKHVPLQYITGVQEFMGLEFAVNEHVLIPRQDTEILVEEVMRHLHDGMRILDMCTGSGCILLSLLYYSNDCTGIGTDISQDALSVARENADKFQTLKNGLNVEFIQSDLFEQLEKKAEDCYTGSFEIIVSNPPYIKSDVIETLMPEVKAYEPRLALDGKEDGLFFYRKIIERAGDYLTGGGELFFEIGYDQGPDVKRMMEDAGYVEVEVVKDFAGLDRVVHGILNKAAV